MAEPSGINIAICCLIKDTPEYLLKAFVEHHRKIGIQDIYFIIDNGSMFVEFVQDEHITYIPASIALSMKSRYNAIIKHKFYKDSKQLIIYNWFYENYRDKYNWIAFIDDDEHLQLDLSRLDDYKDYSAIYLPWHLLINKSIHQIDSLNNFEEADRNLVYNSFFFYCCKSIVNTRLCKDLQSDHYADFKGVFTNYQTTSTISPDMMDYAFYTNVVSFSKDMYIDHYYVRSFEEWIERVFDHGDNWYNTINSTDIKIPNRGIVDYYKIQDRIADIDIVLEDIKQLNRIDVINKLQSDPIAFGFGLLWNNTYKDHIRKTRLYDKLVYKYGYNVIQWYEENYSI